MLHTTLVHQSLSSTHAPLEILNDPNGQELKIPLNYPLFNVALNITVA